MDMGGGAKKQGAPETTSKWHPTTGGYNAGSIESEGEPGDKGVGVEAEYSAPTEDGVYASKAHTHGNYPHGTPDPDNLTGPPLGSTEGGPTHSNY